MKFLHLSDLHLGKRVNEYNLLEEQGHCLRPIKRGHDGNTEVVMIVAQVFSINP